MKTTENLHTAAAAKLEQIEKSFNNLFAQCETECAGMHTDEANKLWQEKYKSRYDALDRLLDAAYRVFWYTNKTICKHNKQVNHRATVARMHAAGLHRMTL